MTAHTQLSRSKERAVGKAPLGWHRITASASHNKYRTRIEPIVDDSNLFEMFGYGGGLAALRNVKLQHDMAPFGILPFTLELDAGLSIEMVPAWAENLPEMVKVSFESAQKTYRPTPPPEVARKPQRFDPSPALIAYVMEAVAQTGVSGSIGIAAKDMIRNAVLGLFNTMAASVRDSGKPPPYALAEGGKFANSVAKALLFRVPVGVYEGPSFLAQLEREVSAAAKDGLIRGAFWRVVSQSTGALQIEVQPAQKVPVDTEPYRRAEVMKIV